MRKSHCRSGRRNSQERLAEFEASAHEVRRWEDVRAELWPRDEGSAPAPSFYLLL